VEETTINADGSGTICNSVDMGKMLAALAAMGGEEKMKDAEKIKGDTTIFLKDIKDSLTNLTEPEKKLLEKGKAHITLNLKEEKFFISYTVPFAKATDIHAIEAALGKSGGKLMKTLIEGIMPDEEKARMKSKDEEDITMGTEDGTPNISSYYGTFYENNKLVKKINKEMVAKLSEDESLKSLKEMGQMGMAMNLKTVINLPRPAKKTVGKAITLSDDKKKVTIEGTLDDFFEDPSKFEYEIEY
ncbi:MAG TPA: hypothetical protein VFP97_08365, partial [Chitinophagaceae bacterium]|nr:hypothetical protein [Chitinophagaceae bacterium]